MTSPAGQIAPTKTRAQNSMLLALPDIESLKTETARQPKEEMSVSV